MDGHIPIPPAHPCSYFMTGPLSQTVTEGTDRDVGYRWYCGEKR